jgi:hypothetical protein
MLAAAVSVPFFGCSTNGAAPAGPQATDSGADDASPFRDASGLDATSDRDGTATADASDSGAPVRDGASGGDATDANGGKGQVPGFPRLGSCLIGNGGYDSGYVQWASKIGVNVIGGNYHGAGAAYYGGSRESLVQAIHSQSSVGAKVFQYYITDNDYEDWPLGSVDSSHVLYVTGTSGQCAQNPWFVQHPVGQTVCNTNQTTFTPPYPDGLHLEGEQAKAFVALINGSSVDAAPSVDGTFRDNTGLLPQIAGDYLRNGTEEQTNDADAGLWIRQGVAEGLDYLHSNSSFITLGNIAGWGIPQSGGGFDATPIAGKVQGGLMEGTFGYSWSAEVWGGFATSKGQYQFSMAHTGAPQLVMVHHNNLKANGSDPTAFDANGNPAAYGTPYQAARYGLAFTLMDDGYYATATSSAYLSTGRDWFDEYAVDPATGVALAFPNVDAGLGYLGQPTDAPWPAPLSSGVYERHFRNSATGISWVVLLNPKGNGARTVQLGQPMRKLTGTQAPAINDGATVTSISLSDRDGLILQVQ